jgi:DnaJ-class molecular chaperone
MQTQCRKCGGKGKTMEEKCPKCRGQRVIREDKHIQLDVEKGMASGDNIIMEREAEQVPELAKGDLIFTLKQRAHKIFKRVGNNLFIDI